MKPIDAPIDAKPRMDALAETATIHSSQFG
jgi:hypothetical protein